MADINVENFYQHVARIFSILYAAFPTKSPVYVDSIAGIDEPDEYGLHSPTYTSGFYALIWLGDERMLRHTDTIRQDGIDQACLTHKAFLRLSEIAEPIFKEEEVPAGRVININTGESNPVEGVSTSVAEERKLVINQLRRALRSGSSIEITKVVNYILRE
jgi:hypothetical protein